MSLIQKVAVRYLCAVDCTEGTTWAWISPQGKFYHLRGGTHGNWAFDEFPDEVEAYFFKHFDKYAQQDRGLKRHSLNYWRQALDSFRGVRHTNDPPKPFGIRYQKVYRLNLKKIHDPQIIRALAQSPVLGSKWSLKTRMSREDNNLLFRLQDMYGDDIVQVSEEPEDTYLNRKRIRDWEEGGYNRSGMSVISNMMRHAGEDYLIEQDWIKASSYQAGQDNGSVGPKAWDTFFIEAFKCLPEDKNPMDDDFYHNNDRMTFADGLERLASRSVQDTWWNRVFSQTAKGSHPNAR